MTKKLTKSREKYLPGMTVTGPLKTRSDAAFLSGTRDSNMSSAGVNDPCRSHSWVYACVRAISQNIGAVPLRIQGGKTTDPVDFSDEDKTSGGQLAALFSRPNPHMTGFQLLEVTAALQNLDGTAFWVLDREKITEIPQTIKVVRAKDMHAVVDRGNFLGWVYQDPVTNETTPLSQAQVLVHKFFNPYNSFYGLSPIEAASRGIRTDILASIFSEVFFANNADPSGVIISEKRLTTAQAKEILSWWEDRHRGVGNAKKVGILYGNMRYQPTQISPKDMEYLEQRKWTRDEVLAVFKVPKSEISLFEDVTAANAMSQDRGFWQKTLIPILKNIEAVLKAHFIPGLRPTVDPNLRMFFDLAVIPALQPDFNEQVKNAETLYRIGYPVNYINDRLKLGMPRVEWGDIWFLNAAFATVDQVIAGTARGGKPSGPTPISGPENPDALDNVDDDPEPPGPDDPQEQSLPELGGGTYSSIPKRISDPITTPQKTSAVSPEFSFFKKSKLDPLAVVLRDSLRAYIRRLRAEQLEMIKSGDKVFDNSIWNKKLQERVKGIYQNIGDSVAEFLGVSPKKIPCDSICILNQLISQQVSEILVTEDDGRIAVDKLKHLFNRLADHKQLLNISRMEVWKILRSVEAVSS